MLPHPCKAGSLPNEENRQSDSFHPKCSCVKMFPKSTSLSPLLESTQFHTLRVGEMELPKQM